MENTRTETCPGCGRQRFLEEALHPVQETRLRYRGRVREKTKGVFGTCDPLNAVVVAAAVGLPVLGATLGVLICLVVLVIIMIVLW